MKMPFGKYKDLEFEEVPIDYLKWLEEQNIEGSLRKEINYEIQRREGDVTSKGKTIMSPNEAMVVRTFARYLLDYFKTLGERKTFSQDEICLVTKECTKRFLH